MSVRKLEDKHFYSAFDPAFHNIFADGFKRSLEQWIAQNAQKRKEDREEKEALTMELQQPDLSEFYMKAALADMKNCEERHNDGAVMTAEKILETDGMFTALASPTK